MITGAALIRSDSRLKGAALYKLRNKRARCILMSGGVAASLVVKVTSPEENVTVVVVADVRMRFDSRALR